MNEPQRRTGTQYVYRMEAGDRFMSLPGGRGLVVNPNKPPRIIEPDDTMREISPQEAELLLQHHPRKMTGRS